MREFRNINSEILFGNLMWHSKHLWKKNVILWDQNFLLATRVLCFNYNAIFKVFFQKLNFTYVDLLKKFFFFFFYLFFRHFSLKPWTLYSVIALRMRLKQKFYLNILCGSCELNIICVKKSWIKQQKEIFFILKLSSFYFTRFHVKAVCKNCFL